MIRMALDAASGAMIMIDSEGQIVLVNTGAEEMFGYAREALLGESVDLLVPDPLRRRHAVYRRSFVNEPHRRAMGLGKMLMGRRRDGTEFPVEVGLTPIDSHEGRFVMSTIMDVTDRQRREDEIRQSNETLVLLNEELTQFAYSASHDLKAPLSTIDGLLRCIATDVANGDTGEASANVFRARDLAQQLAQRVEEVLNLAKSEGVDDDRRAVDIAQIVATVSGNLEALRDRHGVSIEVDLGHDGDLMGDHTRVTQIVENLVSNGIKYSDPDKAERVVKIATRTRDSKVELVVADNGMGIPANRHAEVFNAFTRFSASREPGTGLGLALVRKHVRRIGGEITFTSSGDGSVFTVLLPTKE
jgi:PAS domain S-box-containing protein